MLRGILATAFGLLVLAGAAHAQTANVQGVLPRDLSAGAFDLTITISNISATDQALGAHDPLDEDGNLAARVQLFMTDLAASKRLYHSAEQDQAAADAALPFFVSPAQPHVETAQPDGTYTHVYYVNVREAVRGALAAKLCPLPAADCPEVSTHIAADFYLGGTDGPPVAKIDPPAIIQQNP